MDVREGGENSDEEKIKYAGTGDDVQGGGSDGADIWERELGSDRYDAEGAGGVPPSGGSEDSRNISLDS